MKRTPPDDPNQGEFVFVPLPPEPVFDPIELIQHAVISPARNTDPGTAHRAAGAPGRITQRLRVYRFYIDVAEHGATDYECGATLRCLRTSAGKRRKELLELGLIEETNERRTTDTGVHAIVWRLKTRWLEFERRRPIPIEPAAPSAEEIPITVPR